MKKARLYEKFPNGPYKDIPLPEKFNDLLVSHQGAIYARLSTDEIPGIEEFERKVVTEI